jgi:site-specific DNA recombinase
MRVSSATQRDEGYGLEAQRDKLLTACKLNDWAVDEQHIYVDAGLSGKSTQRPQYQAMLAAVAAGTVRRIVATKLDRLSRNTKDFLDLVDYAKRHGCALVVLDLNIDTGTPTGELVATVLAGIAQWERQLIRERVLGGKRAKAQQGGYNGSPAPFGYVYQYGEWQVVAEQAATVQQAFDLFLAGHSLRGVAAQLNAAGRTSARGAAWGPVTVGYLLSNGAYCGKAQWYDGEQRRTHEADGAMPVLVDVETYEAAQTRLAQLRRGRMKASRVR